MSRGADHVGLTPTEDRVLLVLASLNAQIATHEELFFCLEADGETRSSPKVRLAMVIRSLRKKIEPEPEVPQYLLSAKGRGYVLLGVTR
ncbi:MAG: winged helix-turn-helix domain-containing protein [bacterium]